jgi:hypothetical protein
MLMGYRDNENMILFYRIKELIGKHVEQTFSNFTSFNRPRRGKFRDPSGGFSDFILEL